MESLSYYIKHPEQLDAAAADELYALVQRYPYFQPARLLLMRALYQAQDDRFGPELRKTALHVPDRRKLYELIEGRQALVGAVQPKEQARTDDQPQDRTQSLIDSFLSTLPEQPRPRRQHQADASQDYMAYMMQQNDSSDGASDDEQENEGNDAFLTETLAHIYIKQGKYAKAIEIIRRLSLRNPKKNRYFADQIRFLEKLLINERAAEM